MAQSNSAFTRAASLAQLVLALGPSPRPCRIYTVTLKLNSTDIFDGIPSVIDDLNGCSYALAVYM